MARQQSPFRNARPAPPPVSPPARIWLSEIMADNAGAVAHAGMYPDWVELHNRSGEAVDLSRWSLSDDSNPRKFVFPESTVIPADGYLIVWCDSHTNRPGLHTGFALSRRGDHLFLFDAFTNCVDAVSFGLQIPNYTISRVGARWTLAQPTPGASNQPVVLASQTNLILNEWLANAAPGESDWIELFNRQLNAPVSLQGLHVALSNTVVQLRGLSFVAPGGFVQLFATSDPDPDALGFALPAQGGTITLYTDAGERVDQITYPTLGEGLSQGRYPDGASSILTFPGTASPGASNYLAAWRGPRLNEILARNQRAALAPWGEYADFIEIHNPGNTTASLEGMVLGRSNTSEDHQWRFPTGVILPAGGYLVVWCDNTRPPTTDGSIALNSGFALDGDSGEVVLWNAQGQIVDRVAYGPQVPDLPLGPISNRWCLLSLATPGRLNAPAALLGPVTAIRINEWFAAAPGESDWFELYNTSSLPVSLEGLYLTDDPSLPGRTRYVIPPLSFIAGHGWVRFIADDNRSAGSHHVNFALNQLGECLRLYTADLQLIDGVDFGLQTAGVSEGRLPDGSTNIASMIVPSPEGPNYLPLTNVVINEVLSHTDPPLEDAVELHNLTDAPIDLSGWYLSDSAIDPKRYRIPDGTVLPPRGYCVFYQIDFGSADDERDEPPKFSFNSARGDEVYLFQASATGELTGYRTGVTFGPAPNGVSWGVIPTSVGFDFTLVSHPTFGIEQPTNVLHFRSGKGASNAPARVGPVVINEIHYQPSDDLDSSAASMLEFIELHNRSSDPVPLYDPGHPTNRWRLANAVRFTFPPGFTLPPGGYLVVVPFHPETNQTLRELFQARYKVGTVTILGPYEGRLNNAGETLELLAPDTPQGPPHPDAGYVPYYPVDRVAYLATAPWPATAAGRGGSLQRLQPNLYGNDPTHWKGEAPTPGRANTQESQEPPVLLQSPKPIVVVLGQWAVFTVEASGSPPLEFQWYHDNTPLPQATNPVLRFMVLNTNQAGSYRVRVSNIHGFVLSPAASLTLLVPPQIVLPPTNRIARVGEEVAFHVLATGTLPLSFQWQRNGVNLPGEHEATLRITAVGTMHTGDYQVIVSNAAGSTTAVARLVVQAPPQITLQPRGGLVLVGSRVELRVAASGDPPLRYQWYYNSTPVPGATSAELPLDPVQRSHTGFYAAQVQNSVGEAWSENVWLDAVEAPILGELGWTEEGELRGVLFGEPGRLYAIETSINLVQWEELGRWRLTGTSAAFTDGNAVRLPGRYYRARLIE